MPWSDLRHFRPEEFSRPDKMKWDLLLRLDKARDYAGIPFIITDDYREPDNNVGVEDSAHKKGRAVDVRARSGRECFHIINGALMAGFERIGVYDKHVHLDDDSSKPQKVLWVGVSQ